ncbi:MAG: DUF3347 domain-containing protein [Flavisolibacter sp.]
MKSLLIIITAITTILSSCGDQKSNTHNTDKNSDSLNNSRSKSDTAKVQEYSLNDVTTAYLQLKNALVSDNSKEAASAGKKLNDAMQALDKTSFKTDHEKLYNEVKDDINDHAEHINANANNIAHQREHFDMLSQDVYDLVEVAKPSQTLYKDYCPMYNNKKGKRRAKL